MEKNTYESIQPLLWYIQEKLSIQNDEAKLPFSCVRAFYSRIDLTKMTLLAWLYIWCKCGFAEYTRIARLIKPFECWTRLKETLSFPCIRPSDDVNVCVLDGYKTNHQHIHGSNEFKADSIKHWLEAYVQNSHVHDDVFLSPFRLFCSSFPPIRLYIWMYASVCQCVRSWHVLAMSKQASIA